MEDLPFIWLYASDTRSNLPMTPFLFLGGVLVAAAACEPLCCRQVMAK